MNKYEAFVWAICTTAVSLIILTLAILDFNKTKIRAEACAAIQGRLDTQGNCIK